MTSLRITLITAAVVLALPAAANAAIVFPDGDIVREGLGDSGTTVSWAPPRVTSGSITGSSCTPDSGSAFPTGTTEVECLLTVKVCPTGPVVGVCIIQPSIGTFTVTVTRGAGPALSGLRDLSAATEPGRDSATVDYALPSASDPSGIAAGSLACSPASGSAFPVGETTVTCGARDTVGNESTASFRVNVSATPAAQPAPETPGAPVAPGGDSAQAARAVTLGGRLRVSRGVARVAIACPADNPVGCRGTLRLAISRRTAGSKRFALSPGSRATLRVRLSRGARAKLARGRTVRLRATATTTDQAGRRLTGARTFKVR